MDLLPSTTNIKDTIALVTYNIIVANSSLPTTWSVTHIVSRDIFEGGSLDSISNEAENCSDPQQDRKASKKIFAELDPLWGRFGGRQLVPAVPLKDHLSPLRCQTL